MRTGRRSPVAAARWDAWVVLGLLSTGCVSNVALGGTDAAPDDTGTGQRDTGPVERDGGGGQADAGSVCPSTLPTSGSACTQEYLECQYGVDPRGYCRPLATCMASGWNVAVPTCPTPLAASMCPATEKAAADAVCATVGAECLYGGDSACDCNLCSSGISPCNPTWSCEEPPQYTNQASCPTTMPNLGTACGDEGLGCLYGGCGGVSHVCMGGIWVPGPNSNISCPPYSG